MNDAVAALEPTGPSERYPTVADAICFPDDAASWAAEAGPGPLTTDLLAAMNPAAMSYTGLVDAADALEQLTAWVAALQQRITAEFAARPVPGASQPEKGWAREELALALRVPGAVASDRIALARELTQRFPATLARLERGDISLQHARALVEATRRLDAETAAAVEARVLPRAPEQTLTLFRRSVTQATHALDPAGSVERRERAETDRCVRIRPADDSMATVWGVLPAEGAATVDTALTTLAHRLAGEHDERTVEQRRADALVALCADALTGGDSFGPAPQRGLGPRIQVTVALSTLLAMDQQPAQLAGYGAIPAGLARRLAADPTGTWARLVTDPVGRLLGGGIRSYRPAADLARHVVTRDSVCRFPACTHSARTADLDHTRPWASGGATDRHNLAALDRRHHHLKHEAGWRLDGDPEHELTWTSPAGRRYRTRPAEHPVDRTIDAPGHREQPGDPDPPPY